MTDGLLAPMLVAVGGSAGAVGRYLVGRRIPGRRATALVNVVGSVLLGAVGGAVSAGYPLTLGMLVGTGFCGAFTTYSSFAVEFHRLLDEGEWRSVAVFGLGTLFAALLGAVVGRSLVGIT
ncbi:CrcB family protein [Halorarum halophilum]|uniref:Fluoride-specific ion channel FluC n=1 Tax=Halorarum halophilum TaxID=2743090 RepID=A0A7D5KPI7_9EURY|nr:CrcB family protein [Halobaculum halophilum]